MSKDYDLQLKNKFNFALDCSFEFGTPGLVNFYFNNLNYTCDTSTLELYTPHKDIIM